jgi:site-specific recombinase XerD
MPVVKPDKPYPDFPLYAHSCGKWARKIGGKIKYFGKWSDPQAALLEYEASLRVEINLPPTFTVQLAANTFLTARKKMVANGTLSERSYQSYRRSLKRFAAFIGPDRNLENLDPSDFSRYKFDFARTNNPVGTGNEVTRIKTALKWLHKSKYCQEIDCGPDFCKPSAKVVRRHKRERGEKLFSPAEIKTLLDESGLRMRAMILLGINCAYHNNDCETITLATVERGIRTGTIEHTREKTEIERACPLWTETVAALEAYLARRPQTASEKAFVLSDGKQLSGTNNDVAKHFRTIRLVSKIRVGGFSWLRKTFATYGSESGDQVAVDFIMGHVDSAISGVYRQLVREHRLQKVTDAVHAWLFGGG